MDEYISREKVLDAILGEYPDPHYPSWYANIIIKIPIADITEVKHGKWIDTTFFDSSYSPIYECSICHKEVADRHIALHKYCLHCGAKMD